jgi:anti-anti-sigma factor
MESGKRFIFRPAGAVQVIELSVPETFDSREFDPLIGDLLLAVDECRDPRLVLDLAEVFNFSSALLGLLINLRQRINARGGRLVLACVPPRLFTTLHATSLQRLFVMKRTVEEATADFR